MSMYRTVTVSPELVGLTEFEAGLSDVLINVDVGLTDVLINVETELISNQVEVIPTLSSMEMDVDAEVITEIKTYIEDVDYYDGDYEFTPSQSAQTVQIKDKMARHDITINPIPSNYGLITWNGATLTVS